MGLMGLTQARKAAYLGAAAQNGLMVRTAVGLLDFTGGAMAIEEEEEIDQEEDDHQTMEDAFPGWTALLDEVKDAVEEMRDFKIMFAVDTNKTDGTNDFSKALEKAKRAPLERVDGLQHSLSQAVQDLCQYKHLERLTAQTKNRPMAVAEYLSQCSTTSAGPLDVDASNPFAMLDNASLASFVLLRLGGKFRGTESLDKVQCPSCDKLEPNTVTHALVCPGLQRFRTSRHGNVKKVLVDALRKLGGTRVDADDEPVLSKTFKTKPEARRSAKARRADFAVQFPDNGSRVLVDLVIGAPRQALCTNGNELDPRLKHGNVARALERGKWIDLKRDFQVTERNQGLFSPFAVETSGTIGPETHALTTRMVDVAMPSRRAKRITDSDTLTSDAKGRALKRVYQMVTASVARSNHYAVSHVEERLARVTQDQDQVEDPRRKRAKGGKFK